MILARGERRREGKKCLDVRKGPYWIGGKRQRVLENELTERKERSGRD